jgi:hypothetical protein
MLRASVVEQLNLSTSLRITPVTDTAAWQVHAGPSYGSKKAIIFGRHSPKTKLLSRINKSRLNVASA